MQTPNSLDEFMQQAERFVTKARQDGVDDNRIANTIRFMYDLTQQKITNNQANQITPYQQGQLDYQNRSLDITEQGKYEYNSDTGQYFNPMTKDSFAAPNSDTTITGDDFGMQPVPNPTQSSNTNNSAGFNFDAAANNWTYSPKEVAQVAPSIPATPQMSVNQNMSVAPKNQSTQPKVWKTGYDFIDTLSGSIFGGQPMKFGT